MNPSPRIKEYVFGFTASVVLTVEAFYLVDRSVLEGWRLIIVILALATLQLGVQLLFFLHIADEKKPRIKLLTLLYALGTVFIIVAGSLWIMSNLNYGHDRNLAPAKEDQKIIDDELFKPEN